MSDILGSIGNLFGIGDFINKVSGGKVYGSGSVPWTPGGLDMADKNWQEMYGKMWDQMQQTNPQLSDQLGGAFKGGQEMTPDIQMMLKSLAGMSPQLMQALLGQAGTAGQGQRDLMGAGQQLWQTAQDPQNALRGRMQQQVTDASRAGTSMRGIGMGPESAGLENQAVSNFLMDWQDRQLGRQGQALQGMTGAYGEAGRQGQGVGQNIAGALNVGALGPQFMQQSAQWPFQLADMYGGGMNRNVYGPTGSAMNLGIPYMNQGIGATGQNFDAGQTSLANLNYSLAGLGNIYRPPPQQQQPYYGYQTDPYAMGGYGT